MYYVSPFIPVIFLYTLRKDVGLLYISLNPLTISDKLNPILQNNGIIFSIILSSWHSKALILHLSILWNSIGSSDSFLVNLLS